MSVVHIPGVGVFDRIAVQSPWAEEMHVRYEQISLEAPKRRISPLLLVPRIVVDGP